LRRFLRHGRVFAATTTTVQKTAAGRGGAVT
jgi:hypothetical protein